MSAPMPTFQLPVQASAHTPVPVFRHSPTAHISCPDRSQSSRALPTSARPEWRPSSIPYRPEKGPIAYAEFSARVVHRSALAPEPRAPGLRSSVARGNQRQQPDPAPYLPLAQNRQSVPDGVDLIPHAEHGRVQIAQEPVQHRRFTLDDSFQLT